MGAAMDQAGTSVRNLALCGGAVVLASLLTAKGKAQVSTGSLPTDKLRRAVAKGRTPLVLVSCGSFSPPTLLHTRIMEDARDRMNAGEEYEVIGGYLVPVHDAYGKK